jgi:hypothetical protein
MRRSEEVEGMIVNKVDAARSLPPPPPPTSKKLQNALVIGFLIVVVIVSAAVLFYLAFGNKGGSSSNGNTNPTPSATVTLPPGTVPPSTLPSGTPPPTLTPSSQQFDIDTVQSLQFTATLKAPGMAGQEMYTYTWSSKNIDKSSMMMRIDGRFFETQAFFDKIYIVNGAQQKAWLFEMGEWTDISDSFSTQWSTWNATWQSYREHFATWDGLGDLDYTLPNGDIVQIHDISVNPNLSDTLFQHS